MCFSFGLVKCTINPVRKYCRCKYVLYLILFNYWKLYARSYEILTQYLNDIPVTTDKYLLRYLLKI